MSFINRSILALAHILVSHFSAAMENHGLHFVPLAEEADDLILPHLIIVLGGGRPELYFLDVRALLVLFRFVRFLVLLVLKLPVIHQLANRRHRRRRDFHHIQPGIPCRLHRVEQRHHAKLIPSFVHHAYFPSANALVYSKTATATPFCDKPTSEARELDVRRPLIPPPAERKARREGRGRKYSMAFRAVEKW